MARASAMKAIPRWIEKWELIRIGLFERIANNRWRLAGIWDAPEPKPESFPSAPEPKPRRAPRKRRKTSVETECDTCGTPLAGNFLCGQCDEEAWHLGDIVDCDDNCGALECPTTPKEIAAAYIHWKWHGSMHGCSHQA